MARAAKLVKGSADGYMGQKGRGRLNWLKAVQTAIWVKEGAGGLWFKIGAYGYKGLKAK